MAPLFISLLSERAGDIRKNGDHWILEKDNTIESVNGKHNKNYKIDFQTLAKYKCNFYPNLNLLKPQNLILICDVVEESVFGTKNIKILKLLTKQIFNDNSDNEIIQFSFFQDEFVKLNTYEFLSLRMCLADTTGNLVKAVYKHPTRCQIQFHKT